MSDLKHSIVSNTLFFKYRCRIESWCPRPRFGSPSLLWWGSGSVRVSGTEPNGRNILAARKGIVCGCLLLQTFSPLFVWKTFYSHNRSSATGDHCYQTSPQSPSSIPETYAAALALQSPLAVLTWIRKFLWLTLCPGCTYPTQTTNYRRKSMFMCTKLANTYLWVIAS